MMAPDALAEPRVRVDAPLSEDGEGSMADEVREGLARPLKELPPKYFYDERGSELFDRITTLPEYYPTRCERAILNRHAPAIVSVAAAEELVELGSGSASKTRALLYAMAGAGTLRRYVPVDVSDAAVGRSAQELTELYPGLEVHGVVADFERHLELLPPGQRRLIAFLGGTIGNLHPSRRAEFFAELRSLLGPSDHLLLGVDLVKDVEVLEAAYNDSQGVTAEFNRNILRAINHRLGANFDPDAFEHVAFFDREASWIEMRLRAAAEQEVRIDGADLDLRLAAGEEIRTEISAKFTERGLRQELGEAGMCLERFFTDTARRFAVALASPG